MYEVIDEERVLMASVHGLDRSHFILRFLPLVEINIGQTSATHQFFIFLTLTLSSHGAHCTGHYLNLGSLVRMCRASKHNRHANAEMNSIAIFDWQCRDSGEGASMACGQGVPLPIINTFETNITFRTPTVKNNPLSIFRIMLSAIPWPVYAARPKAVSSTSNNVLCHFQPHDIYLQIRTACPGTPQWKPRTMTATPGRQLYSSSSLYSPPTALCISDDYETRRRSRFSCCVSSMTGPVLCCRVRHRGHGKLDGEHVNGKVGDVTYRCDYELKAVQTRNDA
ncbi:hypothetical protein Hypma_006068 [Hypsizygus marmoreus]|uniref:Uncharacterized protein n=1 Tax=Hypsizygus marmoreus TaxID=39966 RepID=A0A369JWT7_HYPMA|nr:hypothetical protein Hypma_006068 [Hypsizygus marmoreus]